MEKNATFHEYIRKISDILQLCFRTRIVKCRIFYSQKLFCHFFATFCNSAVEPDGENDQDDDHLPSGGNPPAENKGKIFMNQPAGNKD